MSEANGADEYDEMMEFRTRLDAAELRQAAIESRQVRMERLLNEQQVAQRSTNKLLTALNEHVATLNDRVSSLVEAVLELAAPKKGSPPSSSSPA